jgi:hypothetical protein
MKSRKHVYLILMIVCAAAAVMAYLLRATREGFPAAIGMDAALVERYLVFIIGAALAYGFAAATFLPVVPAPAQGRGAVLSILLIGTLLGNALTSIGFWLTRLVETDMAPSLVTLLALTSTLNVVLALAMWNYRKWGVIGFVLCSLVVLAVNLIGRLPGVLIAASLLGTALVAGFSFASWKSSEWKWK